jgi:hypothetical protein
LFPPDDERLSLETCRGRKIKTLKKVKKVRQVGCKSRDNMVKFTASITQDTVRHHHKDHSVNPLPGNNICLLYELYET